MDVAWMEIGSSSGSGEQMVAVPAGKSLKIETVPAGEEVLDVETPAGYLITYHIKIVASKKAV